MAPLSTSTLRRLWDAFRCRTSAGQFLAAYAALDACFRAFAYEVRAKDTGAYNCRRITAGRGWSLHAYGPGDRFAFWTYSLLNRVKIATALAVDVNWLSNPYGPRLVTDMPRAMIDAVLRIRTNDGQQVWRWGGDYSGNKDGMHFEIVCSPTSLATGIDQRTVPDAQVTPTWSPPPFPGLITKLSTKEMVACWRVLLGACGYHRFRVGLYPWSTTLGAATRRFQRNHGLVVDSVVGPKTWAKAVEVLRAKRRKAGKPA